MADAAAKPEEKKEEKKEEGNAPAAGAPGGQAAGEEEDTRCKVLLDTRKEIEQITLTDDKDRIFFEKLRRWKVEIKDIFVTASDIFEGFLLFIIGGDYVLEVYENPIKKQIKKIEKGRKGYTDTTEFKEVLKVDSRVRFEKEFRFEHRDSIVNLMKQHITIEVWEYNSLSINKFKGRGMIEIMKIIKGNIYQFVNIEKREGIQKKNLCKIEFKCFFQEIYDFKLTFQDWGASNLDILFPQDGKGDKKSFSPKLDCSFKERGRGKIQADGMEGAINQEWTAKGELYFRGTLEELEQQTLTIQIISSSDITKIFNLQKKAINYPLRGVALNGLVKKKIVADSSKKKKKSNVEELNLIDDRDPELWGKININNIPKFKQIGFDTIMLPNEVQLCILLKDFHVNYNSMFKLPESVFCTVEFNGKIIETDKIKLQILNKKFNQHFYFLFGEANEMAKCNFKPDAKHRAITDTLKINNEAYVDIWLEDSYKCRDFLGRIAISFLDIFDKGKPADKKYKDETFEVNYRPKIYSGSDSFLNVFDIDAHLDYEVWFYPESYSKDLNIKKSDKAFQKEQKIKKFEDILEGQKNESFQLDVRKFLLNIPNINNRFFGFDNKNFEIIKEVDTMKNLDETILGLSDEIKNYYLLDQLGEYRLLNSYLSKLTVKADPNENAYSIKTNNVEKILRQKRTDIDKVELGIGNSYESLMHYIKCMRFSYYDNLKKKRILLSPDYVMQNRKGNVYEHIIYFACILLNKESENEIIYQKYLEKMNQKINNAIDEPEEAQKDKEKGKKQLETKGDEVLKDKNTSSVNLIGEFEKSTMGEENGKLNPSKQKTDEKNKAKKKADKENNDNKNGKKSKSKKDLNIEKIEPTQLIFVCLGTLKQENVAFEMKKHMWIMKIESNFEDVTFYDPLLMKTFVLKGRMRNKGIMEWYFNSKNSEISNVDINKKKKPSKLGQRNKENEKNKQKGTINHRLNGDDDIDINLIVTKEEDFLNELDYLDNRVNIRQGTKINKNYMDKQKEEGIQQSKTQKTSEIKIDETTDPSKIKEFINFRIPISENGEKIRNDILPYKTLDVIFNKRNIWLNIQHHNPAGIVYDIWDRDRWLPLIESRDTEKICVNHSDIPAFYSFKNFCPPYPEDELILMKKNIMKSLSNGLKLTRNQKNYATTIKKTQQTQDLLELYLIFLEMYSTSYLDKDAFVKKMLDWKKNFNTLMRKKYIHKIYPLYFNYFSETLISSYIQENCADFINDPNKTISFMIACKIFQYPNRVLSVRILLVASMSWYHDKEEEKKIFQLSDEEGIDDTLEEEEEVENKD